MRNSNVSYIKPEFEGMAAMPSTRFLQEILPGEELETPEDYIVGAVTNLQGPALVQFVQEWFASPVSTKVDILKVVEEEYPEMVGECEDAIDIVRGQQESAEFVDWLDTNRTAS